MAMTIFLILNGLGVMFLLYVLANFWNEGHPRKSGGQDSAVNSLRRNKPEVIVVTHPISLTAQGGLSVIPFPVVDQERAPKPARKTSGSEAVEMPVKRFFHKVS